MKNTTKLRLISAFSMIVTSLAYNNCGQGGFSSPSDSSSSGAASTSAPPPGAQPGSIPAVVASGDLMTPPNPVHRVARPPSINLAGSVPSGVLKYSGPNKYGYLGTKVLLADINGDGLGDVVMAATNNTRNVYWIYGSAQISGWDYAKGTPSTSQGLFASVTNGSLAGSLIAADLDHDKKSDLFFADPGNGVNTASGIIYGVWGNTISALTSAFSINPDVWNANANGNVVEFLGPQAGDNAGLSMVSLGDFNGDGYEDLAVGFPGRNQGTLTGAGGITIVFGAPRASLGAGFVLPSTNVQKIEIKGFYSQQKLGMFLASGGDINGDGINDLVVGDPYANHGAGAVYVIYGSKDPAHLQQLANLDLSKPIPPQLGFRLTANFPGGQFNFGNALSISGDIDEDGVSDILIGQLNLSGTWAYVVYGSRDPAVLTSMSELDIFDDLVNKQNSQRGFMISPGPLSQSLFGNSVRIVKDLDRDGYDDILISNPTWQSADQTTNGASVYVIYGRPRTGFAIFNELVPIVDENGVTHPASLVQGQDYVVYNGASQFGNSISNAMDVNGDGAPDFLIGSPNEGGNVGAAYLILGH